MIAYVNASKGKNKQSS